MSLSLVKPERRAKLAPDRRYLPYRLSLHRSRDLTRDPVCGLSHRVGCQVRVALCGRCLGVAE